LDGYGKVFTDSTATVGDVKPAGADLTTPKQAVWSAATAGAKDVANAQKGTHGCPGSAGDRPGDGVERGDEFDDILDDDAGSAGGRPRRDPVVTGGREGRTVRPRRRCRDGGVGNGGQCHGWRAFRLGLGSRR